eukprot:scaffold76316_cov52-Phaeocystis_antarctica.AAC.2
MSRAAGRMPTPCRPKWNAQRASIGLDNSLQWVGVCPRGCTHRSYPDALCASFLVACRFSLFPFRSFLW